MAKSSLKEHIYRFEMGNVILKSILFWILLAAQFIITLILIYKEVEFDVVIISNLVLSVFTIPSLVIHLNHRKYSKNAKLILRYETITMINPAEEITLKNVEITEIILHRGITGFRIPWFDYSWMELIDQQGKSIKVSFYLMEISELWMDTLSRKINAKLLVQKEVFFPMMK